MRPPPAGSPARSFVRPRHTRTVTGVTSSTPPARGRRASRARMTFSSRPLSSSAKARFGTATSTPPIPASAKAWMYDSVFPPPTETLIRWRGGSAFSPASPRACPTASATAARTSRSARARAAALSSVGHTNAGRTMRAGFSTAGAGSEGSAIGVS
jgi:hypothetical protein